MTQVFVGGSVVPLYGDGPDWVATIGGGECSRALPGRPEVRRRCVEGVAGMGGARRWWTADDVTSRAMM